MVQRISLIPAARGSFAGAVALALTALPAAAHPPMHGCGMGMGMGMGAPAPTINVQGEGRASVAPDLATVSLGVTTQAPTAAQAMADNAARQSAVIEALRAQGIAPADLQTQGLNLAPMQDFSREGQPPVITGYQAQNIVTARIRDLSRLGPLLDTMVAAGATDVQGISFSREDAAATEDRARTEAVAEARRRAEVIAGAAGMELGPLVSLTDTSFSNGPRPMAMMARAADSAQATPVETGELTLTAQVAGVWSLMPAGGEARPCGPSGHGDGRGDWHKGHDRQPMDPHQTRGDHGMMQGDHGTMQGQGRDGGPDAHRTGRDTGRPSGGQWQLAPAAEPIVPSAPAQPAAPSGGDGPAAQPAPAPSSAPAAPAAAAPAGTAQPAAPGTTGAAVPAPGPGASAPAN